MMNSMGISVRGRIVIIRPDEVYEEYQDDSRFYVEGGPGSEPFMVGQRIYGVWMASGERGYSHGTYIDEDMTRTYWSLNIEDEQIVQAREFVARLRAIEQ